MIYKEKTISFKCLKINIFSFLLIIIFIKFIDHYYSNYYIGWILYSLIPIFLFVYYILINKKFKYDKLSFILFIFMLYMVINTYIKSLNFILTLEAFMIYFSYLTLYLILLNSKFIKKKYFKYLGILIILMMFISFDDYVSKQRLLGIMGNPNLTAHCILLFLPIILYFQNSNKIFQFFSLILSLILILKTESRSALLAYIIMLLIWLLLIKIRRMSLIKVYFIFIGVFFLTILAVDIAPLLLKSDLFSSFIQGTRYSYTGDNHRGIIWQEAYNIIINNFVTGAGVGIKFVYEGKILGVHNSFLSILVSGGIIGFLFFLYIIKEFVDKNLKYDDKNLFIYKILQLSIFISLSYSAEIFFAMSFHFYILFLFQNIHTLKKVSNENYISNKC